MELSAQTTTAKKKIMIQKIQPLEIFNGLVENFVLPKWRVVPKTPELNVSKNKIIQKNGGNITRVVKLLLYF